MPGDWTRKSPRILLMTNIGLSLALSHASRDDVREAVEHRFGSLYYRLARRRGQGFRGRRPAGKARLPLVHTRMYVSCMRTTINLDDALIEEARRLTGVTEKTALVHEGLRALIERESARRLARLGGSEPELEPVARRRAGGA